MSPGRLRRGDPRQSGGIGRHATFRALCAYARGGSSPPFGTVCLCVTRKGRIVGPVRRVAKPLSGLPPTVGSNPTPSANALPCRPAGQAGFSLPVPPSLLCRHSSGVTPRMPMTRRSQPMRDRDHQRPASVAERLREQFAPAYLTLTSIIQGVALSTLVIRVEGMSEQFTLANWLLAIATLLAFLLVWHEYLMQALAYVWMPTLVDSAVPFGILITELFLAHFVYGNERVWF